METVQEPPKPQQRIQTWWTYYTAEPEEGEPSRKGELAALRRCKTLEEIFFTAQYQNLYRQVASEWPNKTAVAAVAGVLAHVKKTAEVGKVAEHFARPRESGDGAVVSEARFMRLMKIKTHAELLPALIRLIHLAGDDAPLKDLITGVYYWNDKTRRTWMFGYYDKLAEKNIA